MSLPDTITLNGYFSLGEVKSLLAFFGGNNADVSVQEFGARDGCPAGKYAWCTDYPEEGAQWLGAHDVDTDEHDAAPTQAAAKDTP